VVKLRQMIPPLTARSLAGRRVRAWDYKQKKSLLIAFLHADCRRCAHFLQQLREHAAQLTELEAVAIVVFSEAPPLALSDNLPPSIMIATEMSGHAQRAFLGPDAFGTPGSASESSSPTATANSLPSGWAETTRSPACRKRSVGYRRFRLPARNAAPRTGASTSRLDCRWRAPPFGRPSLQKNKGSRLRDPFALTPQSR
jgi:hypothetical protein